ncbi:MAG: DUF692 domain-containing protein [Deltaproteobacteria bacterium]|nr:DUF692 domain-containing protein [Deltaproteobacteria bacterium]
MWRRHLRRKKEVNLKTGLGLRRELLLPLKTHPHPEIDFLELAPENWMELGGHLKKEFDHFSERYPIICHGLSLSIGSTDPLDKKFIKKLKQFLDHYRISYYSEHLSYCGFEGHLYDLLPLPFTEEAIRHVSKRIRQVQEMLERNLAIENISYYLTPSPSQMSEADFMNAILEEADCRLLLDVNNVYVNSINHRYDAVSFIKKMPTSRIAYLHMAGHYQESKSLMIDTHGADVIDPVWKLLAKTYEIHGRQPTLLERDFNIPPLPQLKKELRHIQKLQKKYES